MFKVCRIFLILSCIMFFADTVTAQSEISSPYSRYGLGDLNARGFSASDALGGTGIGLRSNRGLNIINPASYSAIDTLTFIFEFGMRAKAMYSETSLLKQKQNDFNVSYLACGFQIAKWWAASTGLLPYSSIAYKIKETNNEFNLPKEITYNGLGGLNKFYFGNTFKLHKTLSAGFNAVYLFGAMEQSKTVKFTDTTSLYLNFQSKNTIHVNDYYFNFGIQYSNTIKSKYQYSVGAVFDNRENISASRSVLVSSFYNRGGSAIVDTIVNETGEKGTIVLPMNYGLGLTFRTANWLFAADYYRENWSEYRIFNSGDSLANSNSYRAGVEFIPDRNALIRYWKKVSYKAGVNYTNTYLQFSDLDEQLKDYSISLGLGLPVKKTRSVLNVSFILGQRGTTRKDLIKETYGVVSLSFTLSDYWFIKSRFD